jgi:hypothetical protein
MAPGLKASLVNVTRRTFAFAGSKQSAKLWVRRLIDNSRLGLKETWEVFRRGVKGRRD